MSPEGSGGTIVVLCCAVQLACQEALAANAVPAARAALIKLLTILQQQQQKAAGDDTTPASDGCGSNAGSSIGQVSEGWVLRALIKLDSGELEKQAKLIATLSEVAAAAAAAADGGDCVNVALALPGSKETAAAQTLLQQQQQQQQQQQKVGNEADAMAEGQPGSAASLAAATAAAAKCAVQLSEVLNAAVARVKALGVEGFSGEREEQGCRMLEWMSSVAWNAALQVAGMYYMHLECSSAGRRYVPDVHDITMARDDQRSTLVWTLEYLQARNRSDWCQQAWCYRSSRYQLVSTWYPKASMIPNFFGEDAP
jgi:hypothetical protein